MGGECGVVGENGFGVDCDGVGFGMVLVYVGLGDGIGDLLV